MDTNETRWIRPPPWWLLLAPALVSSMCRGLWAPDEPRYAEVAREIFEHGDFLVMHLCDQLYPDKPPLLFWLSGLLGWLSGWSVPIMRFVSIAAAAGTAALTARFARRDLGEREAAWAPVVLLSMLMVSELAGRLQIDPLLTFFCTAAIWCGSAAPGASVPPRRALAAGALAGVAALAKGPVAWVVVGLVLLAWRLLTPAPIHTGRTTRATLAKAIALAVAPVLVWAVLATVVEPKLFGDLFFGQHAGRVVSGTRHPGPPWKYLVDLPLLLLPWTLAVIFGVRQAWQSWRQKAPADPGAVRALAWLAVLLVFFSIIPSKRDLYLLPACPAAALLAARWLVRSAAQQRARAAAAWLGAGTLGVAGVVLLLLPLGALRWRGLGMPLPQGLGVRGAIAGVPLLVGAIWIVRSARLAPGLEWARGLAWTWCNAVSLALLALLPAIDPLKSGRALALTVAARPERPTAVDCLGVKPEAYRFYGGIPTRAGHALSAALAREGPEMLALVRDENWAKQPEWLKAQLRVLDQARVGSRAILIVGAAVGRTARNDDADARTAER